MGDVGHGRIMPLAHGCQHFLENVVHQGGVGLITDNDNFGAAINDAGIGFGLDALSQLAILAKQANGLIRTIKLNFVCQG